MDDLTFRMLDIANSWFEKENLTSTRFTLPAYIGIEAHRLGDIQINAAFNSLVSIKFLERYEISGEYYYRLTDLGKTRYKEEAERRANIAFKEQQQHESIIETNRLSRITNVFVIVSGAMTLIALILQLYIGYKDYTKETIVPPLKVSIVDTLPK